MSDIRSLPPTCDAFRLHLMRALYQLVIWKRAKSTTLSLPPPTEFSRSTKKGFLLAIQMTKLPKPRTVSSKCNCQKDQCRSRCLSRKASAPSCTMACRCCGDPLQCTITAENNKDSEHDDTKYFGEHIWDLGEIVNDISPTPNFRTNFHHGEN
ncbi:hypothetical protein GQR58_015236 [Nymphon striatum]|nr:hypothetical protein GQR58_015236 [Nymphon striatum]